MSRGGALSAVALVSGLGAAAAATTAWVKYAAYGGAGIVPDALFIGIAAALGLAGGFAMVGASAAYKAGRDSLTPDGGVAICAGIALLSYAYSVSESWGTPRVANLVGCAAFFGVVGLVTGAAAIISRFVTRQRRGLPLGGA